MSKGTADLALSLVGYAEDVSKAMEYVFGNVLICPDAAAANAVTFHADIRMKSVTLEGDVYDPSGTLSGGSKPSTSGILIKVQELNALEEQLAKVKRALSDAEKEWDSVKDKIKRWKDARRDLDLQKHQVELLDQRVKESNATKVGFGYNYDDSGSDSSLQVVAEVDSIKEQITTLQASIANLRTQQKEAEAECKRLEKEMSEFKNNRESKLEDIKKDIAKKKKGLDTQTADVKAMQREVQTAELELEQMDQDIQGNKADIWEAQQAVQKSNSELENLKEVVKTTQQKHDILDAKLQEETKQLSVFANELKELDNARKTKEAEIGELNAEETKLTADLAKAKQEGVKANQHITDLQNKYEWILEESS